MKRWYWVLAAWVVFSAGCSQPVLRQDVPVSTDPMGAKIYANGQFVGTTPMSVPLERDRNHILTLVKDSYRQEDVVIRKSYQQEKSHLRAISAGVNSGLFFKDARMGVGSYMSSMDAQEKTGEAYVLVPGAVKIDLTPVSDAAAGVSGAAVTRPATPQEVTAASPPESGPDPAVMARGIAEIGAAAALSQVRPLEKKKETTSSRSEVKPDGTVVTKKSTTSVGVGVNPAALIGVIDTLFKP